ncbi:MAG: antitoxin [Planctomycetota bacterium]
MRTTVTLDPDTERLIKAEVARRHLSFKRVLNDAIRRGLSGPTAAVGESLEVACFESGYQPGIDRLRLQQLADEMEVEQAAAQVVQRP